MKVFGVILSILILVSCNSSSNSSSSKDKESVLDLKANLNNASSNEYIIDGTSSCVSLGGGFYVRAYTRFTGSTMEIVEEGSTGSSCTLVGRVYTLVSKFNLTIDSSSRITLDFDSGTIEAASGASGTLNAYSACGYTDWVDFEEKTTQGTSCETSNYGETYVWRNFYISSDLESISFTNEDNVDVSLSAD